jgi:hypothetical protein
MTKTYCRDSSTFENVVVGFDPSLRIYAILWPPCGVCWTPERKAFSYNKRTMDRAMGPF